MARVSSRPRNGKKSVSQIFITNCPSVLREKVQADANRANRTLAGQARHIIEQYYEKALSKEVAR